jgi:subtilase family serine protease
VLACGGMVMAQSTAPGDQSASGGRPYTLPANVERVCHKPTDPEKASCLALQRTDIGRGAHPKATASYEKGYTPSDLRSAYLLGAPEIQAGGSGKTIAIVDAYDNPNALQDLKVYRQQFGLATGPTITKMNQNGQVLQTLKTTTGTITKKTGTAPSPSVGWGREIALDLDMASAICPSCNILLVEAKSNSFANLGAAVNKAAQQTVVPNVASISNSYGAKEFLGEGNYQSYYNHPGIAITVSSGDNGYGVEFPAASRYVTAVGGTSLTRNNTTIRGWSESAWSGAGSGCSAYIAKPAWQTDRGCANRTVADVSAVADPNTGVAVYNSYGSTGGANWYVFGGTSTSAPIIASAYALAGNTINYGEYPYSHTSALNDVVSGTNGSCSELNAYLCTGEPGYDGPTGLGTPIGTTAF